MAKVSLRLRKHDGKSPEGYPVVYVITYRKRTYYKRTGYYSEAKHWNDDKNTVRASHPKGTRLKNWLDSESLKLQLKLSEAELEGLSYKQALSSGLEDLPSFSAHFELRIKELHTSGDLGNMRFYQAQLKWLRAYFGGEIEYSQLNYDSLQRMVIHCDSLNLSYNTIRQKLQTIKAVYNSAVKRYPGKIPAVDFSGLLAGRKPSRTAGHQVQHQDLETVRAIMKFEPKTVGQRRALDAWRLAFLLQGAGIIDVLYFRPAQIEKKHYPLKRLKMPKKDVLVKVLVNDLAQEIIERWYKPGQPYLFDVVNVPRNYKEILPGQTVPEGSRQYENARTNTDRRLKQVSKAMGLAKPLSMIQARHSWVIIARDLGTPKEIIQQCIGHQGQSVLDRHYFGSYDQPVRDKVNLEVLKAVTA